MDVDSCGKEDEDTKQEREMKGEKKSSPSSFSHILSVCLTRPFFVSLDCHPRAARVRIAECRWKLHGNKPSIFQSYIYIYIHIYIYIYIHIYIYARGTTNV